MNSLSYVKVQNYHGSSQTVMEDDIIPNSPLVIRYMMEKDLLFVKGRSTRLDLYKPYHDTFERAKKHLTFSDSLTCYFHYEIINASTTKLLFNLFKELEKFRSVHRKIIIHWVVEESNLDLIEIGVDLKEHFKLDFRVNIK